MIATTMIAATSVPEERSNGHLGCGGSRVIVAARRRPVAPTALQPRQQVRLLGLVLLGRDRAAIAQVGQAGQRPGDLVRVDLGRGRRRGRRRAAVAPPTATLPVGESGRGAALAELTTGAPGAPGPAGAAPSRIGGAGAQPARSMSTSNSCLASSIAFLNSIGPRSIFMVSMPLSDAVRTVRSPKSNIRPKTDWLRTASLIFSSELSVELAVEHAFDLDDPSVGQHVFLVDVAQGRPDGDRDAAEEQDRGEPAEHVRQRPAGAVRAEPAAEPQEQDRDDDGEDRVAGAPDEDERMLLVRGA